MATEVAIHPPPSEHCTPGTNPVALAVLPVPGTGLDRVLAGHHGAVSPLLSSSDRGPWKAEHKSKPFKV